MTASPCSSCDVCGGKGLTKADCQFDDPAACNGWHFCWKCGPKVKFRKETDEVVCGGHPCQDYSDVACMRAFGHEGPHVGLVRDANIADGVCWSCRAKPGDKHWPNCYNGSA